MELRAFGRTGLEITPIGFGAWAIGGGNWEFGWGPQDDGQAIGAIEAALELGMNWIDTAAVYGLGHSEELVGRALRGVKRRPLVFTKCSMGWGGDRRIRRSLKADSVRRECEASLRRLGLAAIDLYQIHWPNPEAEIEEGWQEMARLKEEGLVRHIGVSNFSVGQMRRLEGIAPVESLQPPYSLLNRGIEKEILSYCLKNGIGVIIYSPMASGLLTGAMTRERSRRLSGRRLAAQRAQLPGTDSHPQPGSRRTPQRDRGAARAFSRRSGRRLDAAPSGRNGRDRRRPEPPSGGRNPGRGRVPPQPGGSREDRELPEPAGLNSSRRADRAEVLGKNPGRFD